MPPVEPETETTWYAARRLARRERARLTGAAIPVPELFFPGAGGVFPLRCVDAPKVPDLSAIDILSEKEAEPYADRD